MLLKGPSRSASPLGCGHLASLWFWHQPRYLVANEPKRQLVPAQEMAGRAGLPFSEALQA